MQENKLRLLVKTWLEYKRLPVILAIVAVIFMLPSLKLGLMMDDLIQRVPQLNPSQTSRLYEAGLVLKEPGKLSTVLFETFGFPRDKYQQKLARDYGCLPWWMPDNIKCSLWRPVTAFAHWLDYRFFPDSPALMHAHNIAWFAAVIFLVTIIYRRLMGITWVAGLAAVMYLLDANTYFPVSFIANRGFIVSLCLGLLCLYTFHKWRTTGSVTSAILSVIFLTLSIFSNEGGVSTFAFVLAYALVLDKSSWQSRLLSLLPAVLVIIIWRIVYQVLGYGTSGMGAYLDPGHEPLRFLCHLPGYATSVISGQLSGLQPDMMLLVNQHLFNIILFFYIAFIFIAAIIFIPVIRKDTITRFWFMVMIFATIPVAAVPVSKNFGFVAVGAYGIIAAFTAGLFTKQNWVPKNIFAKSIVWLFCIILLIVHLPLAAAARYAAPKTTPLGTMGKLADLGPLPNAENKNVVIVNTPCQLSMAYAPLYRFYTGQNIPVSIRNLAVGTADLEVTRINERTLVIKSTQDNIFVSDQRSPLHFSHIFAVLNNLFVGNMTFNQGDKFIVKGLTVEVLACDSKKLPKELAFVFDVPLDDPTLLMLQFNWTNFTYEPFRIPKIGQTVSIPGPPYVSLTNALRFALRGASNK